MNAPMITLGVCMCAAACGIAETAASATSTAKDQKKVAITVYNAGFGVVRDERTITLPKGTVDLRFMEVASKVQPETVQIDAATAGDKLAVLEQNYEYDLMSPAKLMEKYVGKTITIIQRNDFKDARIPREATLLSFNNNQPIYSIDGKIAIYRGQEEVELPAMPENLVSEPTLVWLLDNAFEGAQTIIANYMTQGMRWNADYVAVLTPDEKTLNLNGWVTINNQSGATFNNAQLKLVAGDVQRVASEEYDTFGGERVYAMAAAPSRKAFTEEGLFEYHLYTLDRPTTLKQNQQKQISLLEARDVRTEKTYRCIGQNWWYRNKQGELIRNIKIAVFIAFTNSQENALGIPLPKGTVRVYKADSSGNNQFIGEDNIDHTPKNERIELKLGDAFDITSERRQMSFTRLADNMFEMSWEVKVRNHKDEDITVEMIEPLGGDWKITESSVPFIKKDAGTAQFNLPVKKDGEAVLTYTVRVKW
ncbi:DUF4139 domain-containing protein [bacterium]|nr:DUF4139 domain-containing protein [bacterium]